MSGQVLPITTPDRIGHLFLELDCFFKEVVLGRIPGEDYAIAPPNFVHYANQAFIDFLSDPSSIRDLYRQAISVRVADPQNYYSFQPADPALSHRFSQYAIAYHQTATMYEINAAWANRPSIFVPPAEYEALRNRIFDITGLDSTLPYALLHVREPGYSPSDEYCHSFRNANIATYMPAIETLLQLGFNVVRIGDGTMKALPKMKGLFDYALSEHKSSKMDLIFGAGAAFFMGTSSGALALSSIFNVPVATTNMCLPMNFSPTGAPNQIGIPKLAQRISSAEFVPFQHVFETRVSELRTPQEFEGTDIRLINNTAEDICDLAMEMATRVLGRWHDDPDDINNQQKLSSFIKPGSYSFGSSSLCGRNFMKKHSSLV